MSTYKYTYECTMARTTAGRPVPISAEEVAAAARRLAINVVAEGQTTEVSGPGAFRATITLRDGQASIDIDDNDELTKADGQQGLADLIKLATSLNARLRNDELETFRSPEDWYVHPDDREAYGVQEREFKRSLRRAYVRSGIVWAAVIGVVPVAVYYGQLASLIYTAAFALWVVRSRYRSLAKS